MAGPTASGKSRLALALAEALGGTIVNADSMQAYRDLRILTARPDATAEARVPHRLYGYLDAAERGSVARWREAALAEIAAAIAAGRLPFVVGGTGLYLRALQQGLSPIPDVPEAIRAEAAALHAALGGEAFRERLARLDPETASRLPAGDTQRLRRAWEVARATGEPLAAWHRRTAAAAPYRFATILLAPPRPLLYAAADARFAEMIGQGGLAEAARLKARRLDPRLPAMKAVGVPELLRHLDGEIPLAAAIAAGQQSTRRYAKRQLTWFRHQLAPDAVAEEPFSERLGERLRPFVEGFVLTRPS